MGTVGWWRCHTYAQVPAVTAGKYPFPVATVAGVLTAIFVGAAKAARDWGVVPIDYRQASAVSDPLAVGNGMRMSPPKEAVVSFSPGDVLVLIATS